MRPLLVAAILGAGACGSPPKRTVEAVKPAVATTGLAQAAPVAPEKHAPGPADGTELLGTKPRPWTVSHWINSAPLTLEDLRGHVVLIRWFMSTRCPFCSATAPSLRAFDEQYRSRGLSVVGFYHHKEPEPLDFAKVEETVQRFGFRFPVAVDLDWRTLEDWWLGENRYERKRRATSVSFLLDKQGTIRFVHPGPQYEPGSDDEKRLRDQIERLLAEP
jgi:peroxiredoxin